jgi:aminoglycoside phosphotransferase (APT) family kinase protein
MTAAAIPRLDAALVQRLVAAQFPAWADLPVSPVAKPGWDNASFRLGEDLLVKLPRAEAYAAQPPKEQAWLVRLAPDLPVPIPAPLGLGRPGEGYPWTWSVLRWRRGETASQAAVAGSAGFGRDLARFLTALQALEPAGGPPAGAHNFFRGGDLAAFDAETREAIAALGSSPLAAPAAEAWAQARASRWSGPPVWVHGDVAAGNLLVDGGRLCGVIDFGLLGVGDPACDLAVAWAFLRGEGRAAFRAALPLDPQTWARGRGWALWKALILITRGRPSHPDFADAPRTLAEILSEP